MKIFQYIRKAFGMKEEPEEKTQLEILEEVYAEKAQEQQGLEEMIEEWKEIDRTLELKLQAADHLLESEIVKGELNRKISETTDRYVDKLRIGRGRIREIENTIIQLEGELLSKAIITVNCLDNDTQLQIQETLKSYSNQGEGGDESEEVVVRTHLQNIWKAIEDVLEKEEIEKGDYANAIIRDKEGRILFLKRGKEKGFEPGKYCLPGGHIEKGESVETAVLRELKEEANIISAAPVVIGEVKCSDGNKAYYAECFPIDGQLALLDGENVNAEWMGREQWEKADLLLDLKDHLNEVLKAEDDELEKGGEGSRGGKVIGHTKSGKPIYDSASHPSHKSFTKEEHRQAGELHDKMIDHYSKKKGGTEREYHKNQSLAKHHSLQQTIHNQKGYEKEHPIHKKVDRFLEQFPDDAKKWSQATDEVRDLAHSARKHINELDLDIRHDDTGGYPSLDFMKIKTPSEWNTKGKAYIREALSKMSDYAKDVYMKRHSDLIEKAIDEDNPFYMDAEEFEKAGGKVIDLEELEKARYYDKYIGPKGNWIYVYRNPKDKLDPRTFIREEGEPVPATLLRMHNKAEDDELNIDYNSPDYQDELMKAMLIVEEAIHEDILSTGDIEILKARKPASEGEERTWGGKKWRKVGKKWKPVGKEGDKKEEDKPKPKHSSKDLGAHAENTSTEQLKKVTQEGKHPHHILDAAKRELERRSGEEDAKKDKAAGVYEKRLNNALSMVRSGWRADKIQSIEITPKGNYFIHMMDGGTASIHSNTLPSDAMDLIIQKYGIQVEGRGEENTD